MAQQTLSDDLQPLATELGNRMLSGYPCIVVVHNKTPPEWNVSIVAAGTEFFYQNPDGSSEGEPFKDIETGINVTSGGSVATRSDFPDRCVARFNTVIYVKVPNQDPTAYGDTEQVKPGECLRYKEYTLAPKGSMSHESNRVQNASELFELI